MKGKIQLRDEELIEVSGGAGYSGPLFYYEVKHGDTWASIATKYGTTEVILRQINSQDEIYSGMKIRVHLKG